MVGLSCLCGGWLRADQAIALNRANLQKEPKPEAAVSLEKPQEMPQANGLHFYGQATEANQLGSDYLLYEVQGEQVTGVIFQPQSEYACFQGNVTTDALELAIADPFDGTVYPYTIAFEHQTVQVAGTLHNLVTLAGLNAIATVGESEQELLAQCR
ncbi:MAG: hypothetical protein AAGG51_10135 [Cyanobacteria bacterium P01_G01_bin.54]